MSLYPDWQRQLQAVHHKSADARHAFVATVDEQQQPCVRAMGFLGFVKGSQDVILNTHSRSKKAAHLRHQPNIEICIYAHKTGEQFRLKGNVVLVDEGCQDEALQHERQRQWALPVPQYVRKWYVNDKAPGDPYEEAMVSQADVPSKQQGPPPNFLIVILKTQQVDYVDLHADTRAVYTKLGPDKAHLKQEECQSAYSMRRPDAPGANELLCWLKQPLNP